MNSCIAKNVLLAISVVLLFSTLNVHAQQHAGDRDFFDPIALLLTWQSDPTTSMTIDWHVIDEDRPELEFRILDGSWSSPIRADVIDFPHSDRKIKRVELTGLEPGTYYEFRFGESSKVYNFRTMPADLSQPVRAAIGGDIMHRKEWMEKTARQALKHDLDFMMFMGDLAYADALAPEDQRQRDSQIPRVHNQWYSYFDAYKNTMITDNYRAIPMIVTIGNHEVLGGYHWREDRRPDELEFDNTDEWRKKVAPYFFSLFASPGLPGYGVIDVGDYLSLILLDSDHTNPVENQNQWLDRVLTERADVPHVFPGYHVPAWPSVRDKNNRTSIAVRENWVPIFERHNVRAVFEAHDHSYKRTHPIKNNRIDPNGVTYIGDGAWGVATREIGSRQDHDNWYIAEAADKRHFILMTLQGTLVHFKTISSTGEVIDEIPVISK